MNKYLQSILVFDLALPALLLGLPCCALFWAGLWLQSSEAEKAEEHSAYEIQSRQVMALSAELQPMQAKVSLLKTLLSGDDIEAKLGSGISASLDKLPPEMLNRRCTTSSMDLLTLAPTSARVFGCPSSSLPAGRH